MIWGGWIWECGTYHVTHATDASAGTTAMARKSEKERLAAHTWMRPARDSEEVAISGRDDDHCIMQPWSHNLSINLTVGTTT